MNTRLAGKNLFITDRGIVSRTLLAFCIGLVGGIAIAQTQPPSTAKIPTSPSGAYYGWFARAGWVCGAGASTSSVASKPTGQCGGILSGPLFDLEIGAMGPQANQSGIFGYLNTDLWFPLTPKDLDNKHGLPLIQGGYTRVFGTENALNYGMAYAIPVDNSHSIQFELRDYWAFSDPHDVVFRVVWLTGLAD